MNSPVITPLEPVLGTDHPIRLRVRDGHGRPRNLTGASAVILLKATRLTADGSAIISFNTTDDAEWFTNLPFGTDGIIDFRFPSTSFNTFEDSVAVWWKCIVTIPGSPSAETRVPGCGPFRPQAT